MRLFNNAYLAPITRGLPLGCLLWNGAQECSPALKAWRLCNEFSSYFRASQVPLVYQVGKQCLILTVMTEWMNQETNGYMNKWTNDWVKELWRSHVLPTSWAWCAAAKSRATEITLLLVINKDQFFNFSYVLFRCALKCILHWFLGDSKLWFASVST